MTSAIVLAHVVSIERDHCGHALLRLSTGGVRHAGLTPEQAATELAARLGRRDAVWVISSKRCKPPPVGRLPSIPITLDCCRKTFEDCTCERDFNRKALAWIAVWFIAAALGILAQWASIN